MSKQENVNGQEEPKKRGKINRGPFASVEEANAKKPEGDTLKLFRVVAPGGAVSWVWTRHIDQALAVVTKAAGWSVTGPGKAASKEKVGDLLGQLSAEDRAILIAQYVPASGKGKGKK